MIDTTDAFGIQDRVLFNVAAMQGVVTSAAVAAQGSAVIGGSATDGQTFTLHSISGSATFTYRTSPSGSLEFDFNVLGAHFFADVINRAAMGVTATRNGSSTVTFLADTPGTGGNLAMENHCGGITSVVGMTGGVDAVTLLTLGDADTTATVDVRGTLRADAVILPAGITFQVRHGDYDELQETILANAELGFTDDTLQLFVGDGVNVGGRQLGLRRYMASGWTVGTLNDLLGTPASPDITLITGASDALILAGSSGNAWIPLIKVRLPAGATQYPSSPSDGAFLNLSVGAAGTSSGSGVGGANGGCSPPFLDFRAGDGGSATSTGTGGSGGSCSSVFSFRASHGGDCSGSGSGGSGAGCSGIVTFSGGKGGDSSGSGIGGDAGNIAAALVFQIGGGGASSGAGKGGSGGVVNNLFSISTGIGGTATDTDGGSAQDIFTAFVVRGGNGGNAGTGAGAGGGNSGFLSGGVTIKSGSGGNGGAGADCVGGDGGTVFGNAISLSGGNGGHAGASFSGANGGDAGSFLANGGSGGEGSGSSQGGAGGTSGSITISGGHGSISSHPGGTGGSISLAGSNATTSADGVNGGSIILSNSVNTVRTSGTAQYTFTLPTSTNNGILDTRPITTSNATGTVTFNTHGQHETIYNPSATTIASATITLPTSSLAGQILRYVSKGVLTVITMAGATVDIGNAPTTLAADGVLEWQCVTPGHFVRLK